MKFRLFLWLTGQMSRCLGLDKEGRELLEAVALLVILVVEAQFKGYASPETLSALGDQKHDLQCRIDKLIAHVPLRPEMEETNE